MNNIIDKIYIILNTIKNFIYNIIDFISIINYYNFFYELDDDLLGIAIKIIYLILIMKVIIIIIYLSICFINYFK